MFVIALSSCATAYQPIGLGGGYSETQLGENIFQVTFRGNGYTSRERASDFTLLRSAEVALKHGFRYFVVVRSGGGSRVGVYTTPMTSYSTGSAYASGGYAYGNAATTTYGGQAFLISKPRVIDTILCYKEKPKTGALVFDAEFVVKSLKQKYGLDN